MKLENPGYRLNQRLDKGTICGSFEWKIRLQLSQGHCYDTGISTFLSIVIVIIRKSGTLKIKDTISILEFKVIWVVLNRPFFYVTNCNRNRIRAVLEQGLKETAILNPSGFVLTLLHITGFLILQIFSIYHPLGKIKDRHKMLWSFFSIMNEDSRLRSSIGHLFLNKTSFYAISCVHQ